ncbi:uncharacterized protein LOC143186576 [Calliopsis andreniformis]|uniref:uncharacterized protein LOC143186576 n=1 Tax=Calliopsis andreniformis TaxID=337506 RepID=UPI003FCD2241
MVHFKKFEKESKIGWNEDKTSENEDDEDIEDDQFVTSTDESPTITCNVDDPRIQTILQSLKLNCSYKSCTHHDSPSSNRQEDDSDLKSWSPDEDRKKKWLKSSKHRKYLDTSSEDVDASDANSEIDKKKKRSRFKVKSPLLQRVNTTSIVNATPKVSNRRRSNFSFFNTLFDIVFWPYVFLRANR